MAPSRMPMAMADGVEVIRLASGMTGLAVAPSVGGGIAGFWHDNGARRLDWLRPADQASLARRDPLGLGCFPLVPYSNRIRNGRFSFRNRAIDLPRDAVNDPHAEHGHGWKSAWTIVNRTDSSIAIFYRHAAEAWPFAYCARQDFRLDGDDLIVTLALTNEGDTTMPCGIGLHPYFVRTPACRLRADARRMWRTDAEVLAVELIDAPNDARLDQGFAVNDISLDTAYAGWSGTAVIDWPEWNARLTLRADGPLGHLVVYTPTGESYFCAEPVSNCTDAFNLVALGRSGTGMIELPAGQTTQAKIVFSPTI